MTVRYRIARKPDDDSRPRWSAPLGFTDARDLAMRRLRPHQGEGFQIRLMEPNESPGPIRTLDELRPHLGKRMKNGGLGDQIVVHARKDHYRLWIRKVEVTPPLRIVDVGGNARIDKLNALIVREFKGKGLQNWGVCVRRYIAGTYTWSQHSPWPADNCEANAIDYGGPSWLLDGVYRYLIRLRSEGEPVGLILWRTTGHWDHLHLESSTKRGGPPCSGCR